MSATQKPKAGKDGAKEGPKPPKSQKKQLMILGGLVAVLALVLFLQSSGDEGTAVATTAQLAPTAALSPSESAEQEDTDGEVESLADNEVLSALPSDEGLARSPFTNIFKDRATEPEVVEIERPQVTLEATLPDEDLPMAVLDGRTMFLGSQIEGWELAAIYSRRVVLRSPTNVRIDVSMPVLHATPPAPASADR